MNQIIEPPIEAPSPYTGKGNSIYETLRTIVLVLLTAFLIRSFVMQPFVVQGASMEPTLKSSEYLIVEKLAYKFREPERGEIIVFRAPVNWTENYIKRVIALPGETISIKNNQIYVNGSLLEEDYIKDNDLFSGDTDFSVDLTLGPDEYFVAGDNRNHSSDSRVWGPLPKQNIIGRAVISVFPFSMFGLFDAPKY